MGLFDGYLFCSDMDGTMTVNLRLSQENAEAIREFQREGGIFIASTGRSPQHIAQYAPQFIPNGPVIAINGTLIYDIAKRQVLYQNSLQEDAVSVLEEVADTCPELMEMHITYSMDEMSARYSRDLRTTVREFMRTVPKPWYKAIICVPATISESLRDQLSKRYGHRWNFSRSWPEGIEMIPIDSGKGLCIDYLRGLLKDRVKTVVAAGDFENDITMLQHADIGYAVGNALQPVKEAADRVTVPYEEHAIARIIEDLKKEILAEREKK